eukprot:6467087-Alexandrium_andersonii.AAC.1
MHIHTRVPTHRQHGCSLSYAVRMLTQRLPEPRYLLLHMAKKDALFLREDGGAPTWVSVGTLFG